jgi:hypothetical protein
MRKKDKPVITNPARTRNINEAIIPHQIDRSQRARHGARAAAVALIDQVRPSTDYLQRSRLFWHFFL